MKLQDNITLKNGAASPANVVFPTISREGMTSRFQHVNSTTGVTTTVDYQFRPQSKTLPSKAAFKIVADKPATVQNGVTITPALQMTARFEFVVPAGFTADERGDIAAYASSILAEAMMADAIKNQRYPY